MRRSFKRHVGLNGVYNGDSEFMAGESIMFSGPADKIPAGYLIEDGAEVGRVAYATLFAAIGTTYGAGDGATTFNLPDSRGEFWRGLDMGRGVDVGRVMASAQADAIQNITANFVALNRGAWPASGAVKVMGGPGVDDLQNGGAWSVTYLTFDASNQVRTATENRSRNLAKIPLIKY